MIKKILICKAGSITAEEVEDFELHIKKILPEFNNLDDAERFYKNEALDIYDTLKNHVAQGVLHQLLILMLQGKQDLYRGIA